MLLRTRSSHAESRFSCREGFQRFVVGSNVRFVNEPAAIARGHVSELPAIIRGMSVALLGSVLGGGLGFVYFVVMARMLEQHDFGLLVLAVNLLVAGSAVTIAGADYATIRYVASARAPGAKRGAMIAPIRLVMTLNIGLTIAIALLAGPISKHLLGQPDFEDVLRAVSLALPLTVLAQMFSACLSGLEHARGELVRKVVEQVGRITLGVLVLTLGLGLVAATLSMAAAAAAAAVAVGAALVRSLPRGGTTQPISGRVVAGFAWPQGVANIATQLWIVLMFAIVSHATNARTIGLFGAALAIAQLPLLVYNAFTYRFSPAIARLSARGENGALDELLKSVTRWVAIFALPLYAIAITLPGPLLHVYGSSYGDAATALSLMTIATLLNALAGPVERTLILTGRVRLEMATNTVATVALVPIAFVLIRLYGLNGAAISLLLYTVARNAAKSYLVYRTMKMTALSLSLLRPLTAGAIASGVALAIEDTTALGQSLLGTAVLGCILLLTYVLVLVRFVGISNADRRTLMLAVRPSAAATAPADAQIDS
jgi:O-antigen/teichoic acid export membrane protein